MLLPFCRLQEKGRGWRGNEANKSKPMRCGRKALTGISYSTLAAHPNDTSFRRHALGRSDYSVGRLFILASKTSLGKMPNGQPIYYDNSTQVNLESIEGEKARRDTVRQQEVTLQDRDTKALDPLRYCRCSGELRSQLDRRAFPSEVRILDRSPCLLSVVSRSGSSSSNIDGPPARETRPAY